jgi:hypothetical protein
MPTLMLRRRGDALTSRFVTVLEPVDAFANGSYDVSLDGKRFHVLRFIDQDLFRDSLLPARFAFLSAADWQEADQAGAAGDINAPVAGDAVQPGPEGCPLGIKGVGALDHAQKDVLDKIFRVVRGRGEVAAEGIEAPGMSVMQLVQGTGISLLQLCHQLLVGQCGHGISPQPRGPVGSGTASDARPEWRRAA